MNHPFRPDPSDADRLNDLLDAMRSGTRAPDASNDEANDLARTARQFRGLSDRAASTDPAPATTFDAIWEDMMSAHAISAPTPVDISPATPITPETHRVPTVRGMPQQSRWQSLLSAAIVTLMIAGIIATAWSLRGTGGGGTDPGENARLAATALQDGTPEASPEADKFWMEYMVPGYRDCPPTDRSTEQATDPSANLPDREYLPLSEPAPEDATDVARIAREWRECGGSTHLGSRFEAPVYMDDSLGEQLAAAWPMQDPTDFVLLSHQEPNFGIGASVNHNFIATHTFVPDHAVQLADGRIGVPISLLVWADDPNAPINADGTIEMADWFRTELVTLVEEQGEWKVDDIVMMCIGECDNIFGETLFPIPTPAATPTLAAPTPTSVPRGTSEGIDPITVDFTSYVTPQECRSEPLSAAQYAQIIGNRDGWPVPEYGPISSPNESNAQAAAIAGREYLACKRSDATGIYSSDAYLWRAMSTHSPIYYYVDHAEHVEGNGREVSTELAALAPADLVIEALGEPSGDGSAEYTHLPQYTYEFPDGRIGLVPVTLVPAGTSPEEMDLPTAWYTTMTVLSDDAGRWMVDDFLSICVGDCDDYINGDPWQENTLVQPGATPASSPIASNEWTSWVTPQECTAAPMSQDEYASILTETPDVSGRSYTLVGPADPGSAQAAADSARTWRACVEYRMEDERRGMESPAFIRMWEANDPETQPGHREQQAVRGQELSSQLDMLTAEDFVAVTTVEPPKELLAKWEGNTSGPVPAITSTAYNPGAAMALEDGRILIPEPTLVWDAEPARSGMSHQTTSLQPVTGQVIILANEDGMWKVDELLFVCFGECDDFWAGFGDPTASHATPIATPEG